MQRHGWAGQGWLIGGALTALTALGASGCGARSPSGATAGAGVVQANASARCARRHPGVGGVRVDAAREGQTLALSRVDDRTLALVADEDDSNLHTVDISSGRELVTTALAGAPGQVLVLKDGRVAVTLRDRNQLQVLEPTASPDRPLESLCTVDLPAEPIALAVGPDDRSLLVTSGWGQALSVLDADDGMRVSFQVPLAREPRAVTVSEDGSVAYVAHVVGSRLSAVDLRTPEHPVRTIDVSGRDAGFSRNRRPFRQAKASALPPGQGGMRLGCQGYALARSVEPSGRIFVPQVLVDPGNSEQPSGGYGDGQTSAEVASVGVIDENNGAVLPASLQLAPGDTQMSGQPGRECLLPRAAAVNSATRSLFVACLGADSVIEYDAAAANPRSAEKRRWSLPAGPTGVAVDQLGQRLAVWSQFDQSLSIVQLSGESGRPVTLALSRKAKSASEGDMALGRKLFHATGNMGIAQDGRSCASCHPDGRDDSLTWSTPDGPRNTPMLAGRLQQTGPFGWNGSSESVPDHLHQTFQRLRGQGMQPHEVAALDAFIHGMRVPTARAPMAGSTSAQRVARGKELFESADAGCASCHTGGGSVDGSKHDVTSQARADRETSFDTPTLRFVSGTAPYFHDGRYETLRDMLQGHDGKMGRTGHLSAADLDALEAYLRTL